MTIEITARHMGSSPEIHDYAQARAQKLMQAYPRVEHIHVILNVEKHRQTAEVVVQGKDLRVEAAEVSDNLRASIDMAVDKVERQMRRTREKKVESHRVPQKPGNAVPPVGGAAT